MDYKKEYDILKIYCKFNIYAGIIIGLMEIISYKSLGEVKGLELSLDRSTLFFLLFIQILMLILTYPVFLYSKNRKFKLRHCPQYRLEIKYKYMHIFIFFLLIANILFSMKTGNATLGREVISKFSAIFNIIQVTPLFLIYYVCARDVKNPAYWSNIILFTIFRFMCGWSGHVLTIVFLECFLRIKYKKIGRKIRLLLKLNGIWVLISFLIGSGMYCYVYPFKNSIRYGYDMARIRPLPYMDGVAELLSRFTNYPITVAAVQNHLQISSLYKNQGRMFWEVESILSPLLPRFIMPNKEFRTLSNIVKWSVYPNMNRDTGSGYNVLVYWANIFECSIECFLLAIVVFGVLIVISKKIIYLFDNGSNDVEILYFILLYNIFSGSNFANIFGYGFIPLLYAIPVMVLFGVVKIKTVQS